MQQCVIQNDPSAFEYANLTACLEGCEHCVADSSSHHVCTTALLSVVFGSDVRYGSLLLSSLFLLFVYLPSAVCPHPGRDETAHKEERHHGACLVVCFDHDYIHHRGAGRVLLLLRLCCWCWTDE